MKTGYEKRFNQGDIDTFPVIFNDFRCPRVSLIPVAGIFPLGKIV